MPSGNFFPSFDQNASMGQNFGALAGSPAGMLGGAALMGGLNMMGQNKQVKAQQQGPIMVAGGAHNNFQAGMPVGLSGAGRHATGVTAQDMETMSKHGGFGNAMGQGLMASTLTTPLTAQQARQAGGQFNQIAQRQGMVAPGFGQHFMQALPGAIGLGSALPTFLGTENATMSGGTLATNPDGTKTFLEA